MAFAWSGFLSRRGGARWSVQNQTPQSRSVAGGLVFCFGTAGASATGCFCAGSKRIPDFGQIHSRAAPGGEGRGAFAAYSGNPVKRVAHWRRTADWRKRAGGTFWPASSGSGVFPPGSRLFLPDRMAARKSGPLSHPDPVGRGAVCRSNGRETLAFRRGKRGRLPPACAAR